METIPLDICYILVNVLDDNIKSVVGVTASKELAEEWRLKKPETRRVKKYNILTSVEKLR